MILINYSVFYEVIALELKEKKLAFLKNEMWKKLYKSENFSKPSDIAEEGFFVYFLFNPTMNNPFIIIATYYLSNMYAIDKN